MFTRKKTIGAAILAGCLGLLFAIPSFVPLSRFIPQVEAQMSARLHEPVAISGLALAMLPLPHLEARDITVGNTRLVHVDTLIVRPDLTSLLSDTRVINEIQLQGVQVRHALFNRVGRWAREEAARQAEATTRAGPPSLKIDRVTVSEADIRFRDFWLKDLQAEIDLTDGKPTEIRVSQDGGRLRVTAQPDSSDSWKLVIEGHDWTVPLGLPLQFDVLQAEAIVTATGITADKFSGALYGGTVNGPVDVSWKPTWAASGQLDIQKVDIAPVVALLKRNLEMNGRLTADPTFSTQANEPGGLMAELKVDSDFTLETGTIQKVDLVAAARNPLDRQAGKGGKTEFDRLAGHLVLDPSQYQFSDLEVSSGLFRATGDVTVARGDQKLNGRIDAALRGTASLISMPLHVSGTVQEPSLFLTGTAMAAAVAGSFLMPGIGTAAGIKVSQFTDQLFGPRKPRRKRGATTEVAQPAPRPGRQ
jgi:uncharacterized protein involved in outer membrane biogenesis